ncbi:hypothetical protein T4B_11179 [Trichinella pseudospiralis]|uniref:Uncharacterized protein n=1 Tax=Trichinella pseudospiralis TaxID=6337 RepID=A0A0V1IUM9_TRIPS|nr:hypothetical protein T4C_8044 [Trichinella pseudospiralis]KRZ26509.1 hypothetical protein T4C_13908 [Trichinella pseudospiralis]KRZ28948.1 hypothetical protein T4B_11179 [Trichinella pseudospiralis]
MDQQTSGTLVNDGRQRWASVLTVKLASSKRRPLFCKKLKSIAKDTRLSHLRRRWYCASGGVQATLLT